MWCRRHPLPAALAGLLLLSVAAGFAGVTWKWREAVEATLQFRGPSTISWTMMIAESSTDVNPLGDRFTVLQMLDRAAASDRRRLPGPTAGRGGDPRAGRPRLPFPRPVRPGGAAPPTPPSPSTTSVLGPDHPTTLGAVNVLAAALEGSGRVAAAETLLATNLDACRRVLGPDAVVTLEAENQLGVLLRKRQQLDEAETLLRRSLAGRRRVLRADHPDTLHSVSDLCLLCMDRGRFAEAEALADEYERGIRCARGPKHPDNVSALANRGLIRLLRGRPAEAEPFYRQAVDEARRILGPEHPTTLAAEAEHARVLRELRSPWRSRSSSGGTFPPVLIA